MIEFNTDHYFHIGKIHLSGGKPCQDYAISDKNENMAFGIISDGCSSGKNTDVGSRIISLATAMAIKEHWTTKGNNTQENTFQEINLQQRVLVAGSQRMIGLHNDDMLATCLYFYLSPEGGLVHIQGDGAVAFKYKNGKIIAHLFEWEKVKRSGISVSLPYYPAYTIHDSLSDFIQLHGNDLQAPRLLDEKCTKEDNEEFILEKISHTLSQGLTGITLPISEVDLVNLDFIAIFSDGINQIENLDWKEAIVNLMNFKNTKGEFAKRRMIKEIRNSQKIGKGPLDDISYAVIHIEHIEEDVEKEEVKDG